MYDITTNGLNNVLDNVSYHTP